ncbi:MAG: family 20 glycosylhydrolase, partial [Janthinobacterium lividum]
MAGVLATLWMETLTNSSDVEYTAFPRLADIAQLGWSPRRTHHLEPDSSS